MLSRSAISPLSDPAWPITFWLAAFGFLVTTICLSREVKGSMIYGIVFVTFVSWFRDTSVTLFLDTTLENSNYKYFKQACVERIKKDETGHKHCTGQYFDYWSCIDQCVAPKLFEKLK